MKYKLSNYSFYIKGIFITALVLIIISYYCSKTYFNESFEDDVNVLTDTVDNVNNILSNIKKKIRNQEEEDDLEIENFTDDDSEEDTDSEEETDSEDEEEEEEDFTIMEHLKNKKKGRRKAKRKRKKEKKVRKARRKKEKKARKEKRKQEKKARKERRKQEKKARKEKRKGKATEEVLSFFESTQGAAEKNTPLVKEKFTLFENTAQELNSNIPKQIQGYNCGEYSDFMFGNQIKGSLSNKKNRQCPTPTSNPEDYIFPGRQVNNTNKIKYASQPRVLEYENDVNEKILKYESMNVLPKYKGDTVRFQTGKLSTFISL